MSQRPGPKGSNADVRGDLIKAGCELYAIKGLEPVSLREVADLAGVNQAMIRHYFKDKFGFEKALLDLGGQTLLEAVPENADFETTFRSAVEAFNEMPWFTVLRVKNVLIGDSHRKYVTELYFAELMARFAKALGTDSELDLMSVASLLEMPDIARNVTTDGFKVKFKKSFSKHYASHVASLLQK